MKNNDRKYFVRVNEQIRISPVRVVKDGEQIGIMSSDDARKLARKEGLDLVEIVPNSRPPVCSIVDYGKYRYQQSLKEKEQKQKSKSTELKELRLRPRIAENDVATKVGAAKKFLSQGKSVQFNLIFKNREMAHKDEGFKTVEKILAEIQEVCKIVQRPKLNGNRLICKVEPI